MCGRAGAGAALTAAPWPQVLEVCLDHVATTMSERVRALETDSAAALERLALRVTAGHLEHVRRVKNHMVRLTTRVETIRVLLEKYLGDDDDLAELHLTGSRCAPRFFFSCFSFLSPLSRVEPNCFRSYTASNCDHSKRAASSPPGLVLPP